MSIHDNGERITLEPGVVGAEANGYLAPFGRKIGPDPASINSCMIGGIAANNASGMCCGTAQNSYKTVESMKIIFADGALLDTADHASRLSFVESGSGKALIQEIENIRDEINGDPALRSRIAHKYLIKNTTGYSINAFIDYSDPLDIILHLLIGSEGTLGFTAEITYMTVVEHAHKASALIIFPDIASACKATIILKKQPVAAVELMDRSSLRSVENKPGLPPFLKSLAQEAAALLVETRAGDAATLREQMETVKKSLASIPTVFPVSFTDKKQEYENLWDVRRGLFPAVGAARKIGTTVIIEDVAFPIETLADATLELESLMRRHGYAEGIIFGHALDGNLHFVFTQDFGLPQEVRAVPAIYGRRDGHGREKIRRVAQGGARHRQEHGALRGTGMGREGLRPHEEDQECFRSERHTEPRGHDKREPEDPPRKPEAAAEDARYRGQMHRVRLLRSEVPVKKYYHDPPAAHRHSAGNFTAEGNGGEYNEARASRR